MAKRKERSRGHKIAIGVAAFLLIVFILMLTPWGFAFMKGQLDKAYASCPPEQRANHWSADWYLTLAWVEGTLLFRREEAREMYLDFLGLLPADTERKQLPGDNPDTIQRKALAREQPLRWFVERREATGRFMWNGKFNPDNKTGWGILHPRAPEAYLCYLELYYADSSQQWVETAARHYITVLADYYPKVTGKPGLPHPNFFVYWEDVAKRFAARDGTVRPPSQPKGYPGPEAR